MRVPVQCRSRPVRDLSQRTRTAFGASEPAAMYPETAVSTVVPEVSGLGGAVSGSSSGSLEDGAGGLGVVPRQSSACSGWTSP